MSSSLVSWVTPLPDDLSEEEKRGFDPRGKAYGVIYMARNPLNGKVYIGQTIDTLCRRKQGHLRDAKRKRYNYYFANILLSLGIDGLEWEIVDIASSREELDSMEIYWIRFYRSSDKQYGYNTEIGGRSTSPTLETKKKISETLKRKYKNGEIVNPRKGVNNTESSKIKVSITKKKGFASGLYVSHLLHKAMSPELRERLKRPKQSSAKRLGPPKGTHASKTTEFPSVSIQCIETGKVYCSLNHAAREFGISHTNWSSYFAGRSKSVAGCQWIKVAG